MFKHMSKHMCLVTHLFDLMFNHMSMQMSIWPSFVCEDACKLVCVAFLFLCCDSMVLRVGNLSLAHICYNSMSVMNTQMV